jgi:hypothetical protein
VSETERLKAQLYQLVTEAKQGASSIEGFGQKVRHTGAQIPGLMAESAKGADR